MAEVFGLKQLLEVSNPWSLPRPPGQQTPPADGDPLSWQDKDSDIAGLTQKAEALEAELQDISSQESKDEASLAKVKKQLRDLEAKVKDQEEELDEQAGTIQMLEQVRQGGARFHGWGGFMQGCYYLGRACPGSGGGRPQPSVGPGTATADTAPGPPCHGPAGHRGAGGPAGLRPGGFPGERCLGSGGGGVPISPSL